MLSFNTISFRKLQLDDLPLMHKWLNSAHVHEWYDKDKNNSLEEITERYGPKIKGEKSTDCYMVLYDNQPVGYIQSYKVNDWPAFGKYVDYDDHTVSLDLFIGEASFMGIGFGSMMLKKFLQEIVFSYPDINTAIIGPEPSNIRAINAYEKVGFSYAKTVQLPNETEESYIMELSKSNFSIDAYA